MVIRLDPRGGEEKVPPRARLQMLMTEEASRAAVYDGICRRRQSRKAELSRRLPPRRGRMFIKYPDTRIS